METANIKKKKKEDVPSAKMSEESSVPSAAAMGASAVPMAKLKLKMEAAKKKVDAVTMKDGEKIEWKAGSNPAADERKIKSGTFSGKTYSEVLKKQKRK